MYTSISRCIIRSLFVYYVLYVYSVISMARSRQRTKVRRFLSNGESTRLSPLEVVKTFASSDNLSSDQWQQFSQEKNQCRYATAAAARRRKRSRRVWMDGWVPNLNEMVGRVIRPNIWLSTETVLTDAISAKLCKIRFLNGPCPDSFSYIFVFSNKHYNFYSKYVWRNDHPI